MKINIINIFIIHTTGWTPSTLIVHMKRNEFKERLEEISGIIFRGVCVCRNRKMLKTVYITPLNSGVIYTVFNLLTFKNLNYQLAVLLH
jgi:hypothetical protein